MSIKFIRLDTDKLDQDDMQRIIDIVNQNPEKQKEGLVGKRFLRALMFAAEEQEIKKKSRVLLPPIKPFKETITPETIKAIKGIAPPKPVYSPKEGPRIQREFKEVKYPLLVSQQGVLAFALVKKENDQISYSIIEPLVDKKVVSYVLSKLKGKTEFPENVLTKLIQKAAKKFKLEYSEDLRNKIKYYIYRDIKNLGKIDPILHDHNLTTITSNGKDKPITLEHKTFGKIETGIILNEEEIQRIINRVASKTNEKLTKENPSINTTINGFRFQGTLGFKKVDSKFVMKKENI